MPEESEIERLIRRATADIEPIFARIVAALRADVPGS